MPTKLNKSDISVLSRLLSLCVRKQAFSATTFTVIGVVNKFLTVLVNLTIWDRHATTPGIISLLVCITGAVSYQQSAKVEHRKHRTPVLPDKTPVKGASGPIASEGTASKPQQIQ